MAGIGRPSVEPAFLEAVARGVSWPGGREATWQGAATVTPEFLADLGRLAVKAPKVMRDQFIAEHCTPKRRKPRKVNDGLDIDDL